MLNMVIFTRERDCEHPIKVPDQKVPINQQARRAMLHWSFIMFTCRIVIRVPASESNPAPAPFAPAKFGFGSCSQPATDYDNGSIETLQNSNRTCLQEPIKVDHMLADTFLEANLHAYIPTKRTFDCNTSGKPNQDMGEIDIHVHASRMYDSRFLACTYMYMHASPMYEQEGACIYCMHQRLTM